MITLEYELERDRGLHYLQIEYNYTPEVKGVHTLRNGDPGYPDEPPEVEVVSCKIGRFDVWKCLTPEEQQSVLDKLYEDGHDKFMDDKYSGPEEDPYDDY